MHRKINSHLTLTPGENRIFKMLLNGLSNKEIAQALSVSTNYVNQCVSVAREKIKTSQLNDSERIRYGYSSLARAHGNTMRLK